MGQLLVLAVAVAATVMTAGALAVASAQAMWSTGLSVFSGTATGMTATAMVGASMAAGAVGSVASQMVGEAIGTQEGFSWRQVGLSALQAGMSSGAGSVVGESGGGAGSAGNAMAKAAAGNAMAQGVGVVTGLQSRFNWSGVAASTVGAGVGAVAGQTAQNVGLGRIGATFASSFAGGMATSAAGGGQVSARQIVVNALGYSIVNGVGESGQSEVDLQRQEDMRDATMFNALSTKSAEGSPLNLSGANDAMNLARAQQFLSFNPIAANNIVDPSQPIVLTDVGNASFRDQEMLRIRQQASQPQYDDAWDGNRTDTGIPIVETSGTALDEASGRSTETALPIGTRPAPSELIPLGTLEGFLTFNPAGQLLKGVGMGLGAPVDMAIGVGNLVGDAYGFASSTITGKPYQPQSGLVQSIQSQGAAATAGHLLTNTVKSLPVISQVNSLYHNDMVKLGQSLPGLVGVAGGLRVFGDLAFGAKGVGAFADEAKLIAHFEKHGAEFGTKNASEYLQVGQDIMQYGQKVEYLYKGETRTGFVQFMGNRANGQSKFGFVGMNADGAITTIHTESGNSFWKMLNNGNIDKVIKNIP